MNGSVCPNISINNVINEPMRNINLAVFICSILYIASSLFIFKFYQRKFLGLKKRSFLSLLFVGIGILLELCVTLLQDVVQPSNFPCDVLLWVDNSVVLFCIGGIVMRNVLFYYDYKRYNGTDNAIDKSYSKVVWVVFFLFVCFFFLVTLIINLLYGWYGKGCYGCQAYHGILEYAIPLVQSSILCTVGIIYSFKLKNMSDPLNIRKDTQRAIMVGGFFAFLGFLLYAFDPGRIAKTSQFSWNFIIVFGFLCIFTIFAPIPIIRSAFDYNSISTSNLSREEFAKALISDAEFTEEFKLYCKQEFSYENYLFYFEVLNFATVKNKVQFANEIFNKYIASGSEYELNISSKVRDHLTNGMKKSIKIDDKWFDSAVEECMDSMHSDTYPRFLKKTIQRRKTVMVSSA